MMMYFRKASSFVLGAGLMVLISSCSERNPELKLLTVKVFPNYPSASAIEFNEGKIYVFGDDAPYLLILDTSFNTIDTVHYLPDTAFRISRERKADVESATIRIAEDKKRLYALGSFSGPNRESVFVFDIDNPHDHFAWNGSISFPQDSNIQEVNIEGSCEVRNHLVMANRANTTHRVNQFIIIYPGFVPHQSVKSETTIINIQLPLKTIAGISGLYYNAPNDILFFTASEEDTPSATQDGLIRDSYLGWIDHFSEKMKETVIRPSHIMKLSETDHRFTKQKVESLCLEKTSGNDFFIFLAADNDNGQSTLFRVKLRLPYQP